MSHELNNLLSAYQRLSGDKITDRRKAAESLRGLLESEEVKDYIISSSAGQRGRSSSSSSSSLVTWDGLFVSVVEFVMRDCEGVSKLDREKPVASATAQTIRKKMKQDIVETMRSVLKSAHSRGGCLSILDIIDHFSQVLTQRHFQSWMVSDYSHMLLNYVLTCQRYLLDAPPSTWTDLLAIYCKLFQSSISSSSSTLDRSILARVIHSLISHCLSNCDLPAAQLYVFFQSATKNISQEHNSTVLEHLLAGLNGYCVAVATSSRGRLCKLGEEVCPQLFQAWARSTPSVKDQLVEFLRIQVRVHHPQGAHTDDDGAWAGSDHKWKSILNKVHELVLSECETTTNRLRWASKSEGGVSIVLIDLAVDVIHQIFYFNENQEESRRAGRRIEPPSQPQAKRRRLDTNWTSLIDLLSSNTTNPSIMTWLQLAGHLLLKWPKSLSRSSYPSLLSQLHKVQIETKRAECFQWLFVCLQALASNPVVRQQNNADQYCRGLWKKVWSGCIRTVQMQTAQDEGYSLLAILVEQSLVEVDTEPWKLLHSPASLPKRSLVLFLSTLLHYHNPPDQLHLTWSSLLDTSHPACSSYPLRCLFLLFLLPTAKPGGPLAQQEEQGGALGILATNLRTSNRPPVSLLAHLLLGLIQPSCSAARLSHLLPSKSKQWLSAEYRSSLAGFEEIWSYVERVYMESSFDIDILPPRMSGTVSKCATTAESREGAVDGLLCFLLKLLEEHGLLLRQPVETDVCIISIPSTLRERCTLLGGSMEVQGYHCSLVVHLMGLLCQADVLTVEQALQHPAVKMISSLLSLVCAGLKNKLWSEVEPVAYYKAVRCLLSSLLPLLDHHENKTPQVVKCMLQSIPIALLECIASIATGKWTASSIQPGSIVSSTFSFNSCNSSSNSFDDDMDLVDSVPSENSDTPTSANGPLDILNPSLLSERALCQLEATRFLTLWHCAGMGTSLPSEGDSEEDMECVMAAGHTMDAWCTISKILQADEVALTQPKNIQMALQICSDFVEKCPKISSYTLSIILESLRTILSVHKRNYSVYKYCLDLLTSITRLIVPAVTVAETRQPFAPPTDSREPLSICHSIVTGFWSLYCDGSLPVPVRHSLINVLAALQKLCFQFNIELLVSRKKRKKESEEASKLSLRKVLTRMLNDSDHGIRMHLAREIIVLLCLRGEGAGPQLPSNEQEKLLEEVKESLKAAYMVQADLDEMSVEDESVNRLASMMATLQSMACVSPVCERRVMSVFVSAVGQGHIEACMVSKVVQRTASYLGYSSSLLFLEGMLSELVCRWLDEGNLDKFPHCLLEQQSLEQFYRTYSSKLIPHLIASGKTDTLDSIAALCDQPLSELVQPCLDVSMMFILTSFAQRDEREREEDSQERMADATKSHDYLISLLGNEEFDRLFKNSIGDFVVELLTRLYETPSSSSSFLSKYLRASDPIPPVPHYTSRSITATLDYLPTCYNAKGISFIALMSKRKEKDTIQSILLSLNLRLLSTHRIFERKRLFLAYSLFVNLVCQELKTGLAGTVRFVVMDIIHSIIRIINSHKMNQLELAELFPPCCATLHTLCKAAIENCPQVLGSHLHTIVSTMVPFAQRSSSLGRQALGLLEYFMEHCQSPDLIEYAALLDPFPSQEPFTKLSERWREVKEVTGELSLAEEISRFLSLWGHKESPSSNTVSSSSATPSVEGLRCLRSILRSSQCELKHLLVKSDPQSCSPVIELIRALITIAQQSLSGGNRDSVDVTIATEVGKCLGEIGCVDLACIAIPDSSLEVISIGKQPSLSYALQALEKLSQFLTDPSIKVVHASAECLKIVLSTKTGSDALARAVHEAGGDESRWCSLLEPFKQQKKKKKGSPCPPPSSPPLSAFAQLVDTTTLWVPGPHCHTHQEWIITLVTTLLGSGGVKDEVLLLLKPVCSVKAELAEEIFPMIIHHLLSTGPEGHRDILSRQIMHFFSSVTFSSTHSPSSSFSSATTGMTSSAKVPSESIRTMLRMIMFLRTTNRTAKSSAWDNNFWLNLDFLTIAHAAQLCSAYFTSLLYIEIWHCAQRDKERESLKDSDTITSSPSSSPSSTRSSAALDNPQVQSLLLDVYSKIGEPDGLYGACFQYAVQDDIRTKMFEYENKWEKALSAYNWQMKLPDSGHAQSGILQALHSLNLPHVADFYMKGCGQARPQETEELSEFRFEAAWRCSVWDNEDERSSCPSDGGGGYHQQLYTCLSSLKEGKMTSFEAALKTARLEAVRTLCSQGLENACSIYPGLSKLQALVELEEVGKSLASNSLVTDLLGKWQDRLQYMDTDYQHKETVLALRCSSLHAALKQVTHQLSRSPSPSLPSTTQLSSSSSVLYDGLNHALLSQAELAREAERFQVANGALFTLKHLHDQPQSFGLSSRLESIGPPSSTSWRGLLEEAKLSWASGEHSLAMLLMKNLLKTIQSLSIPGNAESVYISGLSMYGSWLDDSRSENPLTIMEDYLEQAVLMQDKHHKGNHHQMIRAYFVLARYADSQYQIISRRMSSPDFQSKLLQLKSSKKELENITKVTPGKGAARRVRTLRVYNQEDESIVRSMEDDKFSFLTKALSNYILCLQAGDDHDLRVFRLCCLWFDNSTEADINDIMKEALSKVESRKFLPLLYQLAARISEHALDSDPFQQILQEMIYKTAMDHPYHSLYIILALSNACKDDEFPQTGYVTGSKNSRSHSKLRRSISEPLESNVDEDKVKAASNLIAKLKSKKSALVTSVSQLCEAYTDLAYHDVSAHRKVTSPIKLPASCPLLKLKLKSVPIPTMDLLVDPSCKYDNVVFIENFDSCINLCGGINLPKVISCLGSDGRRRRQLVKGKDDLRQDAVMQQVFVLVNRLLAREPATATRRLSIRTYRVVPLTQRSGIVEWCEGTISLGSYLIGTPQAPNQGAHARYHPKDWPNNTCRKKLLDAGTNKVTKLAVYNKICQHFHPVFHHFFMENFSNPSQWFERQLAYTRSVAASSIVGYVVGLGDRHVQNILIDKISAELIHIDLGVAFEEGTALPTPETVPFRLTRDLVDGMGIAGVEGVFRRCCQETMKVIRASHEELRTILEVLIHDPLYLWKLSPHKAQDIQRRTEEETTTCSRAHAAQKRGADAADGTSCVPSEANQPANKMAERVLRRLHEKLEGEEDGMQLSVSGHVNHLIQEATDPGNLSALFHGWQSWV